MTTRVALTTRRSAPVLARSFTASAAAREEYDVAILGGGPGGYVAAIKASQLGLKTVCIEGRGTLGGTCLNVGCIPSKSLLQSTHMYEDANEHFAAHGVNVEGLSYDLDVMMGAKRDVVKGLTGGIEGLFKKNKTDYVKGWGKFIGTNEISVELLEGGNQTVKAKNIIIAAGSEVMPLPPVPVDNEALKIVDSTGALELKEVPKSMVVIGGGYIGLEMGSVWRRLGTEVTVVEFMDTLVPAMDTEVTKMFTRILKKQGMKFKLGQKVTASEVTPEGVKLTLEPAAGGDTTEMLVDVALVSTGRRPLTHGIGLEDVGIQLSERGEVVVDDHFRTNVPSVFAIGDCIRGPMLAHKAEEEGIAAVEIIAGKSGHVNYDAIPGVVYTWPEVATVGKTEDELKAEGVSYNKGTFPFAANSRARANMDADGMVKMLTHSETDRILGIHIIGPNAGELIAEGESSFMYRYISRESCSQFDSLPLTYLTILGVLAVEYGASAEDVGRTCHSHPTLSEAFKEAAMDCYDKPIHF